MDNLLIPASLEELLSIVNVGLRPVAGGTDLVVKRGRTPPEDERLVDLSGVRELKGIAVTPDAIVVGAMETMTAVATNADLRRYATCLSEAAASVGSWQIRNRATLGGNLANASPAADTPSALAALDALVEILSAGGSRKISVPEVLGGPNTSTLRPDEIIAAFHIPLQRSIPLKQERVSAFGKIGSRSEVSIARLNLAASALRTDAAFREARVFVGTLGSAAQRCPDAERALEGSARGRTEAFCEALAAMVDRAIPGRSTRPYKRSAIQALGEDVLAKLSKTEEGRS